MSPETAKTRFRRALGASGATRARATGAVRAAGFPVALLVAGAPGPSPADIPWDRIEGAQALTDAHREVAGEVLRSARCYGKCEDTILECLRADDPTAVRLARFIVRRATGNRSADNIIRSLNNRRLSAFPPRTFDVELSGLVPSGSTDAPVRVVIFADFECSYCRVAAAALRELSISMPDEMSLWFKNYPLAQSPRAIPAALAYLAAERQGLGWEMHDALYAYGGELDDPALEACAAGVGVSIEQYYENIQSADLVRRIETEKAEGVACGVRSTPGVLVNGKPFLGIKTKVELRDRIEEELEMLPRGR